jgi:FAD-dependent monooxygenase
MSTGLSQTKPITQWIHPSVDEYRVQIAAKNDGTMPIEPYQRISQAVFESWLKGLCDENPLVDLRFGVKADLVEEFPGGAKVTAVDEATGLRQEIISRYVVGCDGGSSRVRRSLGIELDGGPM